MDSPKRAVGNDGNRYPSVPLSFQRKHSRKISRLKCQKCRPATSSFRPKRSEVEKSHSPMVCSIATGDLRLSVSIAPEVFIPIPPCPSARDDVGDRQHTVISKGQMTETPPCPVVISTAAKRSGEISRLKWQKRCLPLVISAKAEQLNITSQWYTRMAAGSLSSQGHHKRTVGNDFHFPQPFLSVSRSSYFST